MLLVGKKNHKKARLGKIFAWAFFKPFHTPHDEAPRLRNPQKPPKTPIFGCFWATAWLRLTNLPIIYQQPIGKVRGRSQRKMGKYPGLSAASEKNQGLFQGEMERPCGGDGSDFGRPWPDVCCRRPIPEQHRSARRRHSRIHLRSHWAPLAYINSSRRLSLSAAAFSSSK